jgi:NADH-quinone oxidoreductase subunit M
MIAFLVLETLMIGVFVALDLVLFYLFFEAGLIPMFLIIGIWGGKERIYAAFKFFLYTFLGSVLMLVAMIAMYVDAGHHRHPDAAAHSSDAGPLSLLGWQIVGGHADAAVAGLLRLLRGEDADVAGAYLAARCPCAGADRRLGDPGGGAAEDGRLRLPALRLPMFPVASDLLAPFVLWLSAIAIVYTSLVALMQEDMKKLIAYSSVAHMGFVTMGIFAANQQGWTARSSR